MRFATVVFDFDSTLVDDETLEFVCDRALAGRSDRDAVLAEIKRITELGVTGAIPFEESIARRMALVAPRRADVEDVAQGFVDRISPSILSHLDFFRENGESLYIVSHGFDELIEPTVRKLGIDMSRVFANKFVFDDDGVARSIDVTRPLSRAGGKARALLSARVPGPVVMIGDGYTDYEVKLHGAADAFVAYVEHAHRERAVENADRVAKSFAEVRNYLENPPSEA